MGGVRVCESMLMLMLMLMLFSTRGEAVGCICVSVRKAKDVDPGIGCASRVLSYIWMNFMGIGDLELGEVTAEWFRNIYVLRGFGLVCIWKGNVQCHSVNVFQVV